MPEAEEIFFEPGPLLIEEYAIGVPEFIEPVGIIG